MRFKKLIRNIHLWLGLASGLVVFMMGITGCILVFEEEIRSFTEPHLRTEYSPAQKELLPSVLKLAAEEKMSGKKANGVFYGGRGRSAWVLFAGNQPVEYHYFVYMNPYTAEVLKIVDHEDYEESNFFEMMIKGHTRLWLPDKLGKQVVRYAVITFVILLITGLILLWPKKWKKKFLKPRLNVKWEASFKRLNYDLHNVPGFYTLIFCLILGITGILFSFPSMQDGLYTVLSGQKNKPSMQMPVSDTTLNRLPEKLPIGDQLFSKLRTEGTYHAIFLSVPPTHSAPIITSINPKPGTSHKIRPRFFDQHSGRELFMKNSTTGENITFNLPAAINLYNYDIHLGKIGGLTTKIIGFISSLVAAMLPVTGFLIWYGRKKKSGPRAV